MARLNNNDKDRFKPSDKETGRKKTTRAAKTTNGKSTEKKKLPTLLNYTFHIDEFAVRGLNKYKNVLSAPDCDCGCGGKAMPVFESDDELFSFCGSVLIDNGCTHSAIFLVHKDGRQQIILTVPNFDEETGEEYIEKIGSFSGNDADMFAQVDAELGFHCYGMLIEKDDNCWQICE